jgi:MFS family permease
MASAKAIPANRHGDLRNYALVTGAYWIETLADGATRMLVLFYFYELGYSPFTIASLFIFYEIFGIVTNLVGGWLAARFGLRTTLFMGLGTQVLALAMLGFAPQAWLVVPYVMASQAISGIAKDLTKMSSKSAVKLVVPAGDESSLYRWVAILTGSKNALKGVGFFLGGLMLTLAGFQTSMLILAGVVLTALLITARLMHGHLGRPDSKARFKHMFSNNRAVNILAAARIFLFASRDVWFVVGLPVYLETVLGWNFSQTGGFLAIWVIGYGIVQAAAPGFVRRRGGRRRARWQNRDLACLRAGGVPRRDRRRPERPRRSDPRDRRRANRLRGGVRDELRGPLLPDPRLRRQRPRGDERRLLLHGECRRPARRHGAVGAALPVGRAGCLPLGVCRLRAGGCRAVDAPAEQDAETHPDRRRAGPRGLRRPPPPRGRLALAVRARRRPGRRGGAGPR